MRSSEALKMLKSAGFKHVKTDRNGHQHWELGRHRISISMSQGELDSNIAERVRKLCSGSDRVGDAARGAEHREKEEQVVITHPVKQDIQVGSRVRLITRPSQTGAVWRIYPSVKPGQKETANVKWDQIEGASLPYNIQVLELIPEEVGMPSDEVREEKKLSLLDENATLEDGIAALEALAEREYAALTQFYGRVETYGRLVALSEQLGINVKPLPFVLLEGLPPGSSVHHVEVGVDLPPEGAENLADEIQERLPAATAEVPVTRSKVTKPARHRRAKRIVTQETVLEFIQTKGEVTKTELSHWARSQYKAAHAIVKLLIEEGSVKVRSVRMVANAPQPSKVYSLRE